LRTAAKEILITFIKVNAERTGTSSWIDAMVDTLLALFDWQVCTQGQCYTDATLGIAQEIAQLALPSHLLPDLRSHLTLRG
jgi:hypothetical protein